MNYSKFNLFIRSLLFSVYFILSIFIYSFVCVLILPLPLRVRFKFIDLWLMAYMAALKFICHIDYVVEHQERIPKDRSGVIFSKHQSTYETLMLPLIFPLIAPVAKRELIWIPFFGWGLWASAPILINRKDKKSAMQQIIDKGTKFINEGRWIMVFPEGTRIPFGKVGEYRLGGARLAHAAKAPLVPIAHNAGRYWPKRAFIKQPGTVRVVVGPVIEGGDHTPEEILQMAKTWIEDTMKRL